MSSSNVRLSSSILCLILFFLFATSSHAAQEKKVLVLHSYHAGFSWTDAIQRGIEETFDANETPVALHVEYLDTKRNPSDNYLNTLLPVFLANKLQNLRFDLVMVSDNDAFDFALKHRSALFNDAPVVFCGVNYFQQHQVGDQEQIVGVAEYPSFKETISTALRLQPDLEELIVLGTSRGITAEKNRSMLALATDPFKRTLKVTYWDDAYFNDLPTQLDSLQEGQAILLTSAVRLEDGRLLDFPNTARFVRQHASVPIYGLWDFFLGEGIVGGKLVNGKAQGVLAANLATHILNGRSADSLQTIYGGANNFMFDYRELARFGFDPDRLPSSSQLIHQPKQFYEISPGKLKLTVGLAVTLLLLLVTVATMFFQRQRSQLRFKENSQFLESLINAIPIAIFYKDKQGRYTGCNDAFCDTLGRRRDEIIGKTVEELYSAEEAAVFRQADEKLIETGGTQAYESSLTGRDDHRLTIMLYKAVFKDAGGKVSGLVGSMMDLTKRKQTEVALQESEHYNRMLFEHSPLGLVAHDSEGDIIDANPAFAEVLGLESSSIRGKNLIDLAPDRFKEDDRTIFQKAVTDGRYGPIEKVFHHQLGHTVPVLNAGVSFMRGDRPMILSSFEDISARKRATRALKQSEELFRTTFETSPDAISINRLDDGLYVEVNQGFSELTGYRRQDVMGRSSLDIGLWETPEQRDACISQLVRDDYISNFETVFRIFGGDRITVLMSARIIDIGGEQMMLSVVQNIETVRQARQDLLETENKYRRIFDNIQDVYYESSIEGEILEISPSIQKNLLYQREELIGQHFNLLYRDMSERQTMLKRLMQKGSLKDYEIWLKNKHGEYRPCAITSTLIWDDEGKPVKIIGSLRDITERKTAEEETRHLAYFDTLTGLPNRTLFQDRLDQALAHSQRSGEQIALLFLDLDRFKDVNDTLGHSNGDLLLTLTGQRLQSCIRHSDTVARLGGDEFVLLLSGVQHEREVVVVAQKVLKAMAAPVDLEGNEVFTTASIGIVLAPTDGQDYNLLMKHADMAMYAAKAMGRNTYKFFSKEMNRKAMERHELETNLRSAIKNQEFFLEYQPLVDAQSARIIGMEALLRWQHPQMGRVAPDRFIPVAEDTGLIRTIGQWVLATACRQCQEWTLRFGVPFKMAVNLSGHQFKQPDFLEVIEIALQGAGLEARQLELELTESVLMENANETISILTDLKMRGVSLSVDDFGTGYSSLSYLKNFPIDRVKIDRSFVCDITSDPNDAAIVETIIAMGHSLGLKVVGEGVEGVEQLEFLRARHCDELQGFYFGTPLPAAEMSDRLHHGLQVPQLAS